MKNKQRHPVNLKQYRKVGGKWQFVPVARDSKGNPDPRLVLLNGESVSSKGTPSTSTSANRGNAGKSLSGWFREMLSKRGGRNSPSSPG